MKLRNVVMALCLCVMPLATTAVSFDCSHTESFAERAVCADDELSRMDDELAGAFRTAVETATVPGTIKATWR
ncbi:MAG: hypothetical protein U1F22_11625 [Lysobacterales bacterium]